MIALDTETMGLCGPAVLMQYRDPISGRIVLYNFWKNPVQRSLDLIEYIMLYEGGIVLFNATFDHFQLCKIATMLSIMRDEYGADYIPERAFDNPRRLGEIEKAARDYDLTLRPAAICDLMLWAQKGRYQRCMDRDPIILRRIPKELGQITCDLLNEYVKFDPILFSDRKTEGPVWNMTECKDKEGNVQEHLTDVICTFHPSISLKTLAKYEGLVDHAVKIYADVGYDDHPVELTFAPYALAFDNIKSPEQWETIKRFLMRKYGSKKILNKLNLPYYGTWLHSGLDIINFWETDKLAREYAEDDVIYTEGLFEKFGYPEMNDDDSVLAASVSAARWKGYAIDEEGLKNLEEENLGKMRKVPFFEAPRACLNYITEPMSPLEKALVGKKTGKIILEGYAKKGGEVGRRAKEIFDARAAKKEVELIHKILVADRLHASFKVIGALTTRMSGSDGINAMGIRREKHIRNKFPLKFPGFVATGGDASAFEVCLYQAVSQDENLYRDLTSFLTDDDGNFVLDEKGEKIPIKIHARLGQQLYPGMSYLEVIKNKELYTRAKSAVFAILYGGVARTLEERLGVSLEIAERVLNDFLSLYPKAKELRLSIEESYTPLAQDQETGRYHWRGCKEYVESLMGFRRYFNEVEIPTIRKLYDLCNNMPDYIRDIEGTFTRNTKRGEQSAGGVIMSAIFGAMFSMSGAMVRQSNNHQIQSTGAGLIKRLQRRFWEIQPVGMHRWENQVYQCHDELICITREEHIPTILEIKDNFIKEYRSIAPLLDFDWTEKLETWADK
jgi:hypothetical protein